MQPGYLGKPGLQSVAREDTPRNQNRHRKAEYQREAAAAAIAAVVVAVASLFAIHDLPLYPVPLTRQHNTPCLFPRSSIFRKPASLPREKLLSHHDEERASRAPAKQSCAFAMMIARRGVYNEGSK